MGQRKTEGRAEGKSKKKEKGQAREEKNRTEGKMNIISAIIDKNLFRPFLPEDGNGKLSSWKNWSLALRAMYGLPIKPKHAELVKKCTGRDIDKLPKGGASTILILVSRRGGKSTIAGLIAAFEGCLSGKEAILSPGEMGLVSVISPTKLQSQIVKSYIRAALSSPMLEKEIIQEDRDGFTLSNNIRIQILTGDFKAVRGFTQIAVIVDEICFFGLSEESKVRNDTELIAAIRPALLTTKGKLIAISTKYCKRGWGFRRWKKYFKNEDGKTLIWEGESRLMNPTLSQEDIDQAVAEDPASGRAEYLNEWRENIGAYLPREVIESVVKKNRLELLPRTSIRYFGFVDVSGGRVESSALGIGHKEEKVVVVDFVREYKSPANPHSIIALMAEALRKFRIRTVVGDNYSGEFAASAFKVQGFRYQKCSIPKSQLFLELIPTICSQAIELLDDGVLINQLANLERHVRSGGKDFITHPPNQFDDVGNAIAGVSFICGKRRKIAGSLFRDIVDTGNSEEKAVTRRRAMLSVGVSR